jgi:hypothetical protein
LTFSPSFQTLYGVLQRTTGYNPDRKWITVVKPVKENRPVSMVSSSPHKEGEDLPGRAR